MCTVGSIEVCVVRRRVFRQKRLYLVLDCHGPSVLVESDPPRDGTPHNAECETTEDYRSDTHTYCSKAMRTIRYFHAEQQSLRSVLANVTGLDGFQVDTALGPSPVRTVPTRLASTCIAVGASQLSVCLDRAIRITRKKIKVAGKANTRRRCEECQAS